MKLNGRHTIASDVAATEKPKPLHQRGAMMKPPMYAKLRLRDERA